MAVKIRLTRTGKKKQPSYRVVVMDSRKPRDGEYIEQIGRYEPRQDPSVVEIDNERALDWLHKGAQPTERAQKLLEISGAWAQFRVDRGEIHTVGEHQPTVYPEKKVTAEVVEEVLEEVAEAVEEAAQEAAVEEAPAEEAAAEEAVAEETPAEESSEEE